MADRGENTMKFAACIASVMGNVIETASETVAKPESHPLSAFITKHWANAERYSEYGKYGGRALGAVAGLVLAGYDLLHNAPEAFGNHESKLGWLYVASGGLGAYCAVAAFLGSVPFFWPILILSILVGVAIAKVKASAIKDWISRCKFGRGEHYDSLDAELQAFNSAAGG